MEMENFWWSKQSWIVVVVIVLLVVIGVMNRDSLLDTEQVAVDEGLYNVGVLIAGNIHDNGWNQAHYEQYAGSVCAWR